MVRVIKKGKVTVCRIHDIAEHKSLINLLIVRKLLFPVKGAEHFPQLAPREELFYSMIQARKVGDITKLKEGLEIFKQDIKKPENMAMIKMIQKEILDQGFDVTLSCYCEDVNLCHRKIVAEEFRELGYEIDIY